MFVTFSLLTVFCSFFISQLTSFLFPCIYSLHAFTSFVFFRFAFFIIMFPSLILFALFVSQSFFLLSHLPLYHGFSLFKFVFFFLLSSFPPFALLTFPNFHLPLCISLWFALLIISTLSFVCLFLLIPRLHILTFFYLFLLFSFLFFFLTCSSFSMQQSSTGVQSPVVHSHSSYNNIQHWTRYSFTSQAANSFSLTHFRLLHNIFLCKQS